MTVFWLNTRAGKWINHPALFSKLRIMQKKIKKLERRIEEKQQELSALRAEMQMFRIGQEFGMNSREADISQSELDMLPELDVMGTERIKQVFAQYYNSEMPVPPLCMLNTYIFCTQLNLCPQEVDAFREKRIIRIIIQEQGDKHADKTNGKPAAWTYYNNINADLKWVEELRRKTLMKIITYLTEQISKKSF